MHYNGELLVAFQKSLMYCLTCRRGNSVMEGDQGDLARLVYITHSHSAPSIWSLSETLKTYSSLE